MPMPEIETYKKVVEQTEVLQEAKNLTQKNVECTKLIAEYTLKNQESAEKQYITSRNLSWIAIGLALISLIYGCISSNNTDKLYKQQLQKQDKIIMILKQSQTTKPYKHQKAEI